MHPTYATKCAYVEPTSVSPWCEAIAVEEARAALAQAISRGGGGGGGGGRGGSGGGGGRGGGRGLHSLTSELNLRTFGTHRSR